MKESSMEKTSRISEDGHLYHTFLEEVGDRSSRNKRQRATAER